MKKLTMNMIAVLTMIVLLQLVAVGADNFSSLNQGESLNIVQGQAGESITFSDSNDVNDVNNVGDVNDVNDPNQSDSNE
ncbi:MAG TPA: hypothetical protein PLP05_07220 [Sedimentisphaerales bacterium]|nr:hypothetical protein [Sedimentisphaerales bacterium]